MRRKGRLVFEAGYRYITAPNADPKNRFLMAATGHFPVKGSFLITDRNRADLDWKAGQFTWRYRNKLTFERTFAIHSYHLIPYGAAEAFYESQYSKWSTTSLMPVAFFPSGSMCSSILTTSTITKPARNRLPR